MTYAQRMPGRCGVVLQYDTPMQDMMCRYDTRSAGDFLRQEALRRAGILFHRDSPALVLSAELSHRYAAVTANDGPDQVNPAVAGGVLQNLDDPHSLFRVEIGKRGRGADDRAE